MIHFKNLERDNSLADLTCTPCTTTGITYNIPSVCQQEKEKENTMSYAHAQAIYAAPAPQQTLEEKQRAYLVQRSREVYEEHLETLSKDFEVDPPKPKTVKEMREWLKTGHPCLYTVDGKDDAEIYFSGILSHGARSLSIRKVTMRLVKVCGKLSKMHMT